MAVPTDVNVPLALFPRVVMAPMQTTMISANHHGILDCRWTVFAPKETHDALDGRVHDASPAKEMEGVRAKSGRGSHLFDHIAQTKQAFSEQRGVRGHPWLADGGKCGRTTRN
jgi:hypothetical protein